MVYLAPTTISSRFLPPPRCYIVFRMRKSDIAKQIARRSSVSQGEAADRLDHVVRQILSDLRRGKETKLPGLGRFVHTPDGGIAFEPEGGGRRG